MKEKIKIENILSVFIIICPILDIVSFIYRNVFNTSFSPSTIARPIIPAIVMLYLFIKKDNKFKLNILLVSFAYLLYGIIHIYAFSKIKTGMSYSGEIHELQYIVNYTFMILNLFLYISIFKNTNIEKLKNSVLIASGIYIVSIYIAILTKTSSHTYVEDAMGYKGWFESGNSISSILLLSMFIYLPFIKEKKYRKIVIPILVLVGAYLSLLIGTRAGLFGFILIIALYVIIEFMYNIIKNKKVNKKLLFGGISVVILVIVIAISLGSNTIERRKHLKNIESNIIDESKNENSHITGDLLNIKEKIDLGKIEEGYMSEAQKSSVIDLYNIANELKIKNNDYRTQQLIYNIVLVKNQKNILLILFGNGYLANYCELVLEMEVPAILINFGLIGFILYLGPFLAIFILGIYNLIKNRRKIDSKYIFWLLGCGFTFALSFFSGYTFFSSSTMMMIVALNTILLSEIEVKKE